MQLISQSTLRNRLQNELKDPTSPVTEVKFHPTQIKSLVPDVLNSNLTHSYNIYQLDEQRS